MVKIKSNADTAQELATALTASGDALSGVATAKKDEATILAGNDSAHQAIDTATTIESIGTNLQTIANGFTQTDEAVATNFK